MHDRTHLQININEFIINIKENIIINCQEQIVYTLPVCSFI